MAEDRMAVIRRVQANLDAMPDHLYASRSFKIAQRFIRQAEFTRADLVGLFIGFGGEIETLKLIEATLQLGKRVCCPTVDVGSRRLIWREVTNPGKEIDLGPLGIPQPLTTCPEANLRDLDLVAVPGVVWDEQGHRLARWPNYFNNFLSQVRYAYRVGLAFDLQVMHIDLAPLSGAQVYVDGLITEDRMWRFGMPQKKSARRLPGGPPGYKG